MRAALNGVFTVVVRKGLDEIDNLHVHKGRDAVVELEFGKEVEKIVF